MKGNLFILIIFFSKQMNEISSYGVENEEIQNEGVTTPKIEIYYFNEVGGGSVTVYDEGVEDI